MVKKKEEFSNYLWLCPICKVFFNKTNGAKEDHIKEEIEAIKNILDFLNEELKKNWK